MEYFSEIYGEYYRAVAAVLSQAMISPLSEREIAETVELNAFGESALYIVPKLTSGQWPLLYKNDDGLYAPVIRNKIRTPLTALQRAWLSACMDDDRASAFFDPCEKEEIKAALCSEPLYDNSKIASVDASSDGDDFSDGQYTDIFRTVLDAIHKRELLRISYTSGKGGSVFGCFAPFRLEYSPKDNKMRLHCVKMQYGKAKHAFTINLARIHSVSPVGESLGETLDIEPIINKRRRQETAVIELTDERNALERFMVQFASYDKHTRHDEKTDRYICSVSYGSEYETELLINLLSFGPVIKILAPESLVSQAKKRINRQAELMGRYL